MAFHVDLSKDRNCSGYQVHGSQFTVSDLAYRKNPMSYVFDSEWKPSTICIDYPKVYCICLFSS